MSRAPAANIVLSTRSSIPRGPAQQIAAVHARAALDSRFGQIAHLTCDIRRQCQQPAVGNDVPLIVSGR